MKTIIRKTDQLGRVLIPKDFRMAYGIDRELTEVELIPMKDGIFIRKVSESAAG